MQHKFRGAAEAFAASRNYFIPPGKCRILGNQFPERSRVSDDRRPADVLLSGGAERLHPPLHRAAFCGRAHPS